MRTAVLTHCPTTYYYMLFKTNLFEDDRRQLHRHYQKQHWIMTITTASPGRIRILGPFIIVKKSIFAEGLAQHEHIYSMCPRQTTYYWTPAPSANKTNTQGLVNTPMLFHVSPSTF